MGCLISTAMTTVDLVALRPRFLPRSTPPTKVSSTSTSPDGSSRSARTMATRNLWSIVHENGGRQWRLTGMPEEVKLHDFLQPELGKTIPYGVYNLVSNQGWVSVGIDHDTARFAVDAIRRWWHKMDSRRYRNARTLLITADGGGQQRQPLPAVESRPAGPGSDAGCCSPTMHSFIQEH